MKTSKELMTDYLSQEINLNRSPPSPNSQGSASVSNDVEKKAVNQLLLLSSPAVFANPSADEEQEEQFGLYEQFRNQTNILDEDQKL